MVIIDLIGQNLFSPAVLFFILGIVAGSVRSDLDVPESISRYLAIYLIMAIGFKGGVTLVTHTSSINLQMFFTIGAGLLIGCMQPFIGYTILRKISNLDSATAAAVAAHYGSISVVTFVTATNFLTAHQVYYEGYIVGVLALMEAPGIISGVFIARSKNKELIALGTMSLLYKVFTNGTILLLIGSFIVGCVTGHRGLEQMDDFLIKPFQGILAFFLLDLGLIVSRKFYQLKDLNLMLILFGIYMPIIGSLIGLFASWCIGLDLGTTTLLMVLCASASYIAVPAAMRTAIPEAKAAIYVPMSLAITFPFNISIGIPLYFVLAKYLVQ